MPLLFLNQKSPYTDSLDIEVSLCVHVYIGNRSNNRRPRMIETIQFIQQKKTA